MTAHPEIREAAAVAVPDSKYGEVVGVWIVREPHTHISREDVRSCVSKMNPQVRIILVACSHALSSFYRARCSSLIIFFSQCAPAWVWFVNEDDTIEELPKTASGKVMKHVLRKRSKELAEQGKGLVGSMP